MVATDVASRGIGMIENPFPSIAMPSRLYSSALLSTLRRFLACVTLPGLCRVLRFSIRESWIRGAAFSLLHS
jgi:ATP-dependent RNA helicase DDX5/DBP2